MKYQKCTHCKKEEAIYSMQYIDDDEPQFYLLGWHIRGFKIIAKLCDNCRKTIKKELKND